MKKLIALLLAVCMLLGLMTTAFAADEKSNDIVILHTNDVHCGVSDGLGYAGVAAYKAEMEQTHNFVTLVDCGDAIQGEPIGLLSAGSYLVDIMNEVGYDFATFGNHEFDYKLPRLEELTKQAKYQYLSCNFRYTGKGTSAISYKPYEVVDYGGTKVAFVGITTPESFVKSTPAYFQDDNGNFIYNFSEDKDGSTLYQTVQTTVNAAKAEGAKYVVAIAHLGMDGSTEYWTSEAVIQNTTGIDAMLDGHSHEEYSKTVANKDGDSVVLAQTKTKLANLGKLTISADGKITSELISAKDYTEAADIHGEGWHFAVSVIERTFPGLAASPYVMTGGTDARFYQEICPNCIRFGPVIYGPEQLKGMHGLNENITCDCLQGTVDFYKNLIDMNK